MLPEPQADMSKIVSGALDILVCYLVQEMRLLLCNSEDLGELWKLQRCSFCLIKKCGLKEEVLAPVGL